MAELEQSGIMAIDEPTKEQSRWKKYLPWAMAPLAVAVLFAGVRAVHLRANPGPVMPVSDVVEDLEATEDLLPVQSVESAPDSAVAAPMQDLPISPVEGARAPDFTLSDLDGQEWTLSELGGSAVMLNFWATW